MSKNAQAALTALNTAGLLALTAALLLRGEGAATSGAAAPSSPADAALIAELERRLARLEGAAASPDARRPAREGLADAPTADDEGAASAPPAGAGPAAAPEGPVTRTEVEALIAQHLARRREAPATSAPPAPAATKPRRSVTEVARELGLDARQESSVRELYRQLERDSMKVLFDVDDAGLEQLKADLARAEHDPRLKEQLRERIAVNWTRRSSEVGVLWVKLDARLREVLGLELLPRFYGFDVQLDEREFPDLTKMFFAPPQAEAGAR